jgi:hypothetical protein
VTGQGCRGAQREGESGQGAQGRARVVRNREETAGEEVDEDDAGAGPADALAEFEGVGAERTEGAGGARGRHIASATTVRNRRAPGHCGGRGAAVRGWDDTHVGTFQGSSFPDHDYAWVSVGSGWWTVPVVLGWGTIPDRLVRGSAEAPVGTSICRSGSTTHWRCGTVPARNETVDYSQGAVHQMTRTSVCAEPGDSGGSGGSFISGDQAQGGPSGGWGNCSGGGETWFQPVNEILGRYGLTPHTA